MHIRGRRRRGEHDDGILLCGHLQQLRLPPESQRSIAQAGTFYRLRVGWSSVSVSWGRERGGDASLSRAWTLQTRKHMLSCSASLSNPNRPAAQQPSSPAAPSGPRRHRSVAPSPQPMLNQPAALQQPHRGSLSGNVESLHRGNGRKTVIPCCTTTLWLHLGRGACR